MKQQLAIDPPLIIRIGDGHWKPPKTVVLELESAGRGIRQLPLRRFSLLMDGITIYHGEGYGIEKFGDYVTYPTLPREPAELRLDAELLNPCTTA